MSKISRIDHGTLVRFSDRPRPELRVEKVLKKANMTAYCKFNISLLEVKDFWNQLLLILKWVLIEVVV